MPKRIGLLYGMERDFPPALAEEINRRGGGAVVCEPVHIGALRLDERPHYDVIVDRISHEVPFYRTFVKQCAAEGALVVNNPFWFSADDKYFGCLVAERCGVAVPKTVVLPHYRHPPGTEAASFSNLRFPLEWEEVFAYLGFPIFLKPAYGGGWKDVTRCPDPDAFFKAYHASRDLCMMAQEEIRFTEYFRCYVLGRERVHVMRYDPGASFFERYVQDAAPVEDGLRRKLERDCLELCKALGYDFNTVELALRDGVPYAIDFTNPVPDCNPYIGRANFEWVLHNAADFLVQRAKDPPPLELAGDWPERKA